MSKICLYCLILFTSLLLLLYILQKHLMFMSLSSVISNLSKILNYITSQEIKLNKFDTKFGT